MQHQINMYDAQANLSFVLSQTEHVESEVYAVQYTDIQYPELLPVDTSAPDFATAVTYMTKNRTGEAKWISGSADDVPLVGLEFDKDTQAIESAALGYRYTFEEIGQAQMLGIPLSSEMAMAANRGAEELVERVAITGDTTKGFQGLINNTNVTAATAPNGAGASPLWTNKTSLEILKDVNDIVSGVWTGSKTVELADTLLLSPERLAYIASTPLSADNPMTIMRFIMENNLYKLKSGKDLKIGTCLELTTAGSGSTQRMVAYRRSPDVLKFHMPMAHRFLPAQNVGLAIEVPGILRIGGTDIRKPGAMRYLDGI